MLVLAERKRITTRETLSVSLSDTAVLSERCHFKSKIVQAKVEFVLNAVLKEGVGWRKLFDTR